VIGLRQLFFVVRGLLDKLEHLSKGLSIVLAFIGAKLVLEALHENSLPFLNGGHGISWAPEVPTAVSLVVVVGIILITALTSTVASRRRRATEEDLAIANYDSLTADEIVEKLPQLSQIELAKIAAYERKHGSRTTVLNRVGSLLGDEPWPGYDDMTAEEIVTRLRDADDNLAKTVRAYERTHKSRKSVLEAAERELATA